MVSSVDIQQVADEIAGEFELFEDWMGKYEHLIDLGKELPLIADQYKTEEYLVRGCQSQVWIKATATDSVISFTADSDALITRGLIAILLRVLNKQPARVIMNADLSFLDRIGMKEHLSPTRKNGLDAMIKQIKLYAVGISHVEEA